MTDAAARAVAAADGAEVRSLAAKRTTPPRAVQRRPAGADTGRMRRRGTLAAVRRLEDVDPVWLAGGFAVVIAVLGVLGAIDVKYQSAPAFDLDAEAKLPAFAAGLIL